MLQLSNKINKFKLDSQIWQAKKLMHQKILKGS